MADSEGEEVGPAPDDQSPVDKAECEPNQEQNQLDTEGERSEGEEDLLAKIDSELKDDNLEIECIVTSENENRVTDLEEIILDSDDLIGNEHAEDNLNIPDHEEMDQEGVDKTDSEVISVQDEDVDNTVVCDMISGSEGNLPDTQLEHDKENIITQKETNSSVSENVTTLTHSTDAESKLVHQTLDEVMSAIDKTSSFLDSDPPSTVESTTSEDQDGLPKSLSSDNLQKMSSLSPVEQVLELLPPQSEVETDTAENGAGDVPPHEHLTPAEPVSIPDLPNGLLKGVSLSQTVDCKDMIVKLDSLQKVSLQQQQEIKRLREENSNLTGQINEIEKERDYYHEQVRSFEGGSKDDHYETQIKQLEIQLATSNRDLKQTRDKLQQHDTAAKRAVSTLQTELKHKVDQVTKMYEDCLKEKEGMVVKYAQAEQKNIEVTERSNKIEARMRDMMREREQMLNKFKQLKSDREKAVQAYEIRHKEMLAMKHEMEKQKDLVSSHVVKIKWTQNKYQLEMDQHKETKAKMEEFQRRMKSAQEEAAMVRRDCQSMVKTYQEAEEIKSNSLDLQLKEKQVQIMQHQQEKSDQEEVYKLTRTELENLKKKHKVIIEELKTWQDKVKCQDTERIHQEQTLTKFKEILQSQKIDNEQLRSHVDRLLNIEEDYKKMEAEVEKMKEQVRESRTTAADLQNDMDACSKREGEHMEFIQEISDKNARLQSENSALTSKVTGYVAETERLTAAYELLETKAVKLEMDLAEESSLRKKESEKLSAKLADKTKTVEDLTIQMEDGKDEIKTLKRRHQANIKDLTRQLHQAKKRLETFENKDATSMGSRTSSNTSLETTGMNNHGANLQSRQGSQDTTSPQEEAPPIVEVIEIDKQMLVEKIVKLQKAHARKNEKLEFMQDHIHQLVEEIRKKARIIQMYVLREESGTLSSESADANKAQMAKKAGIMASLYTSHLQDGTMTLDLSLEINHKLQAVLEDTLLKNITLKDNLETLGQEIAKLSQQNRQLQLDMQGNTS